MTAGSTVAVLKLFVCSIMSASETPSVVAGSL
jgi:hypothetical protein